MAAAVAGQPSSDLRLVGDCRQRRRGGITLTVGTRSCTGAAAVGAGSVPAVLEAVPGGLPAARLPGSGHKSALAVLSVVIALALVAHCEDGDCISPADLEENDITSATKRDQQLAKE